ncbi:MAG: hypothetical protein IPG24_26175 [Leptospiraceae bacterium]|nr:hypothetical protein [Leptospiraceae bacterium]
MYLGRCSEERIKNGILTYFWNNKLIVSGIAGSPLGTDGIGTAVRFKLLSLSKSPRLNI